MKGVIVADCSSRSSSSLMKQRYSLCCHHILRLVQDTISRQDRPMLLVTATVVIMQIRLSRKVRNKKKKQQNPLCATRGARKTAAHRNQVSFLQSPRMFQSQNEKLEHPVPFSPPHSAFPTFYAINRVKVSLPQICSKIIPAYWNCKQGLTTTTLVGPERSVKILNAAECKCKVSKCRVPCSQ